MSSMGADADNSLITMLSSFIGSEGRAAPVASLSEQSFGEESYRKKQRRMSQGTSLMPGSTLSSTLASGSMAVADAPPTPWQPFGTDNDQLQQDVMPHNGSDPLHSLLSAYAAQASSQGSNLSMTIAPSTRYAGHASSTTVAGPAVPVATHPSYSDGYFTGSGLSYRLLYTSTNAPATHDPNGPQGGTGTASMTAAAVVATRRFDPQEPLPLPVAQSAYGSPPMPTNTNIASLAHLHELFNLQRQYEVEQQQQQQHHQFQNWHMLHTAPDSFEPLGPMSSNMLPPHTYLSASPTRLDHLWSGEASTLRVSDAQDSRLSSLIAASSIVGSASSSTRNETTLALQTLDAPSAFTLPRIVAHSSDISVLSEHQAYLRLQIEAFSATEADVHAQVRGRNKSIRFGQVGIRCRHCAHLPPQRRTMGSTYFPSSLMGFYQAAQNMLSTHLQCGKCSELSSDVQEEFKRLLSLKSATSGAGRKYWATQLGRLGLVDTTKGVFALRDLPDDVQLIPLGSGVQRSRDLQTSERRGTKSQSSKRPTARAPVV